MTKEETMSEMPSAEGLDVLCHLIMRGEEDTHQRAIKAIGQFANFLRQTTEGTDALVSDLSEEANIVHCYEEMTNLCRHYEQRLKVVEAETVERCAKVCDLLAENHKHIAGESQQGQIDAEPFIHTAQTLAKAIRALEEKK